MDVKNSNRKLKVVGHSNSLLADIKNSNLLFYFMIFIMFFMVINSAAGYNYSVAVDKSTLPLLKIIGINVTGANNSIVNLHYAGFLKGPSQVLFNNSIKKEIKLNLTIPYNTTKYNLVSNVTWGVNGQYAVNSIINNDVGFNILLDPDSCLVNDPYHVKIIGPINSSALVGIKGDKSEQNYSMNLLGINRPVDLLYVPVDKGLFQINANFSYRNETIMVQKNFSVFEKLSCTISSKDVVEENETIKFTPVVSGGANGLKSYSWNFGDGATSKTEVVIHKYPNDGSYEVALTVTDRLNYKATCKKPVKVENEKYQVSIIIRDNATDEALGDVLVNFGTQVKKTNINGKAIFYDVESAEYELLIARDGYQNISEDIDITSDFVKTIKLSKSNEEEKQYPKITILYPLENVSLNKDYINFDFIVKSDMLVEQCDLLINDQNLLGYKIYGTLYNVTQNREITINTNISNGNFKWKIQCENSLGVGSSIERYFDIYGVTGIINTKIEDPEINKSEIPIKVEKKSGDDSTGLIENINVSIFDEAVSSIDELNRDLLKSSQEVRELFNNLGYDHVLVENKKAIKDLKQTLLGLNRLSISEQDRKTKISEIISQFNELKSNTPARIEIVDKFNYDLNTEEINLTGVIVDYLDWKNTNLTKYQLKTYNNKVLAEQKNLNVLVSVKNIEVENIDSTRVDFGVITKEVSLNDGVEGAIFVEQVGNKISDNLNQVIFSEQYELVKANDNPIVRIYLDSENKKTFSYYIKKKTTIDDLKDTKSILLLDINHPKNKITGFSVFDTSLYNSKFIIIIIVLGILIAGNYFIFFKGKSGKVKSVVDPRGSKNKVLSNMQSVVSNFNILKGNIADNFKSNMTNLTDNFKVKDDFDQLMLLLNSVIDRLNQKDTSVVLSEYPKVLDLYYRVDKKMQNDLAPIMSHLYYELETYHLNKLIIESNKLIMDGRWYEAVKPYNEILDTLALIPDKFKKKLTNGFERLDLSMQIHLSKSHNVEFKNSEVSVDDMIFRRNDF